jgi:hypothetical protein
LCGRGDALVVPVRKAVCCTEACRCWRKACWRNGAEHLPNGDWGAGRLDAVGFGLGGEHTLGLVAVTLTFAVLFVGVLDGDFFVHEVLAIHVCNGIVGGLEIGEGDETVAFGEVGFITGNLDYQY